MLGVFFCTYLVAYVYTNAWHVVYGCPNPQGTMVVSNTFVHMDIGVHDRWIICLHYKLVFSLSSTFKVLEFFATIGVKLDAK